MRGLTSWSSVLIVPDSTLNSESWPTYGSAIVLNTKARGWPEASGFTSVSVSPARTVTGGRSEGDGPISQRKSARRSTPTPVTADPHTTGNTVASATPWASVCSSSVDDRDVALEVPLDEGVVGDHDALDEVVVHLVLQVGEVVGDRLGGVVAAAP